MKMTKQMTKALTKLNDAITNLPEFESVMKIVPPNVAITNCELIECETHRTWGKGKNKVTYYGLVLQDGDNKSHDYLLECCGLEFFSTKKNLDELAQDILDALKNVTKKKDKDIHALNVASYLSEKCEWNKTDEVYPHMRQNAIGTFRVDMFYPESV